MKMGAISLRLKQETLKELRTIQKKIGIPVSELIRRAIEDKLKTTSYIKVR